MKDVNWQPDFVLDIRNLDCPISLLQFRKRLKEMEEGKVLQVRTNNDGIRNDLVTMVSRSADECLIGTGREEESYFLYIQKRRNT
jgi:TusA-related sulfurtransferase